MNLHPVIPTRFPALLLLSSLPFIALASAAFADTTLLNTDFEDNTVDGYASYYTTNQATPSVVTDSDDNHYLNVTSPVAFRGVYSSFSSPATLAAGDSITLSFELMFTATTSNVRFGLFTAADGNGYFTSVSAGGTTLSIGRDGDSGNDPGSGSTNSITPTSSTAASSAFAANTWYDASMTLTIISSTTVGVTVTLGDATVTGTRTGTNFNTFDMFYIGPGNNNARLAIDDVLVTTTAAIPEPRATAALAGLAALVGVGLLRFRRRRTSVSTR